MYITKIVKIWAIIRYVCDKYMGAVLPVGPDAGGNGPVAEQGHPVRRYHGERGLHPAGIAAGADVVSGPRRKREKEQFAFKPKAYLYSHICSIWWRQGRHHQWQLG